MYTSHRIPYTTILQAKRTPSIPHLSLLLPLLLPTTRNQFLDKRHPPLLLFTLLRRALLRVDTVLPIAFVVLVVIHRCVAVETHGFETFGCMSEFLVPGGYH